MDYTRLAHEHGKRRGTSSFVALLLAIHCSVFRFDHTVSLNPLLGIRRCTCVRVSLLLGTHFLFLRPGRIRFAKHERGSRQGH